MIRPSWDETWMALAYLVSMRSIDQSSHIGAVVVAPDNSVRSVGYNGLPRGIEDCGPTGADGLPSRLSPINGNKYRWTEHSERNAIYNAGRNQTSLDGCTMYCTLAPCSDCARGMIQMGISRLVLDRWSQTMFLKSRGDDPNVWAEDHKMVFEMLGEAGVQVDWMENRTIPMPEMFFSGITLPVNGEPND